jgi:hypothetical protein
MIGGGFLDSLKSGLSWFTSKLPMMKQALSHVNHPLAKAVSDGISAVGYGKHSKGKLENIIM